MQRCRDRLIATQEDRTAFLIRLLTVIQNSVKLFFLKLLFFFLELPVDFYLIIYYIEQESSEKTLSIDFLRKYREDFGVVTLSVQML